MRRSPDGKPVLAYVNYNDMLWKKHAKSGSIVWVIGLGPDGTPTLEARFPIKRRRWQSDEKGRSGIRVESERGGGVFFGLNDASDAVMKLVFTNKRKRRWSLRERQGSRTWISRHGLHLRAARRIAEEGQKTDSNLLSTGVLPSDVSPASAGNMS